MKKLNNSEEIIYLELRTQRGINMQEKIDPKLSKMSIDELTICFMESIHKDDLNLFNSLEYLIKEDFENFEKNIKEVISSAEEETKIKKAFESKIWKAKLVFSKWDRLQVMDHINDIKILGEHLTHKLLLYRVVFPDDVFKQQMQFILTSLKSISNNVNQAVNFIGKDLEKAHNVCENVKEERRNLRKKEGELLKQLWNYEMDYLSRTFLYLKELIEGLITLGDQFKKFVEYIEFLATKYLNFK